MLVMHGVVLLIIGVMRFVERFTGRALDELGIAMRSGLLYNLKVG